MEGSPVLSGRCGGYGEVFVGGDGYQDLPGGGEGRSGFEDVRDLGEVDYGGGGRFSFLYSFQDDFRRFFDLLFVSGQCPGGFEDGVDEDVGVYEPHSRVFPGWRSSRFTACQSARSFSSSTSTESKKEDIFSALFGFMTRSSPRRSIITSSVSPRCSLRQSAGRDILPWESTLLSSTCIVFPHFGMRFP